MSDKLLKKISRFHFKVDSKRRIQQKSFVDSLLKLKQDWNHLLHCHALAKDPKFLRRMAINIQQIHYDVQTKQLKNWQNEAEALLHFLSTPLGAPFVAKMTFLEAVEKFGEQDPISSDLSELLGYCAHFRCNTMI
jgi:hypothetical protein